MANKKHYIFTSLTLGLIAAASALLIGGSNMLTKDKIAQNETNKINSGIAEIFGESAAISSEANLENNDYKYVNYVYTISSSDNEVGYAFRTSGSNMYGKISLIIGFDTNEKFKSLTIITDEQTYASTLEEKYLDQINKGERDINDVNCGATYGAKLVRDMVNEAQKASQEKVWTK